MDVYASEREQIDAIRKWWKDNGTAITLGVALGLGALFGWQYWQRYRATQGELASIAFQEFNAAMRDDKIDETERLGAKLLAEHGDSGYAGLTALLLARHAVEQGEFDIARAHLEWVVANDDNAETVAIARLRLGRLHLAQDRAGEAWAQLADLPALELDPAYHELRGDVLVAQDKTDDARREYNRALDLAGEKQASTAAIEMKLDALGLPAAAPNP